MTCTDCPNSPTLGLSVADIQVVVDAHLDARISAAIATAYGDDEHAIRRLLGGWVSELEPILIRGDYWATTPPYGIIGLGLAGDLSAKPCVVVPA